MDPLGGMGPIGLVNQSSTTVSSGFPQSLTSLAAAPGSPAKGFSGLGQVTQTQQGFNPLQSLTSQLQGEIFWAH